jgi:replicative DNA helicase
MSVNTDNGFGFLGVPYQKRLILQLITDTKFANNIIDYIDPNYFTDNTLRIIVAEIKEASDLNEVIPDIDSLGFRLKNRDDNDTMKIFIEQQLNEISQLTLNDSEFVQDRAMKFCKQQELKKSVSKIQIIIDKGNIDDYDECEEIMKKALEVGHDKDDAIDIFDNIVDVLNEDFRRPIPTGILGLDDKMNGGLAKGELGVILAPFGVGKTTMMTKIANEAFNLGYKVLQVFFEDTTKVIQRKHLSCWSEIELNKLGDDENKTKLNEIINTKNKGDGYLKLKKFSSDGTTIPMIKKYIRKLSASGSKPDIILLDYIDCVVSNKKFDKGYEAEGAIMRQFESLLTEFDMVGWTAVQGNRASIGAETVDSSMMGGSIQRGQIGHFVVSVAKTLDQKENGRANMAILKSRFGIDGIIFSDIVFDNARIQIIIDDNNWQTASQRETSKNEEGFARVKELMHKRMLIEEEKKEENKEENKEEI